MEEANLSPPDRRRSPLRSWPLWALAAVVVALFASSFFGNRTTGARKSSDATRLFLQSMFEARQVFLAERSPSASQPSKQATRSKLISDLTQLVAITHSARSIRRLSLAQYMLDDPGWKSSLLSLRTIPDRTTAEGVEAELAMWNGVLDGRPPVDRVPELRVRIAAMDMGWFQYIALESLYRRAGLTGDAKAESDRAAESASRLFRVGMVQVFFGLFGLAIGGGLLYYRRWREDHPASTLVRIGDRLLAGPFPHPITPEKSRSMYAMFLAYLIAQVTARWLITEYRGAIQAGLQLQAGSVQAALFNVFLSCIPLVAPAIVYLVARKRTELRRADLGFRTSNPLLDVAWGIAGYAVALPLVLAAGMISRRLFGGLESPLNPAIAQFAATRNTFYRAVLFAQAAMLAPLVEETMFRGTFYTSLVLRWGRTASLVVASAVFAVLHPQLPMGFLDIFVLGAVFNWIYQKRGSLIPGIVAHALNNAMIFVYLSVLLGD